MPEVRLIDAIALMKRVCEKECGPHFDINLCDLDDDSTDTRCVFRDYVRAAPTIEAEPVVHCKDCVYYHKPHVQRNDGTECDISEVPDEYKPFPLTNMCNSDYGINVGGKCEYDNNYAPYEDDKTVFRQPEDFCSRGRRKE